MNYVNEFVSQENLKKFHIVELWNTYHPFNQLKLEDSSEIAWVYDQLDQSYLVLLKIGKEEWSNEHTFVFYYDSQKFIVILKKESMGSQSGVDWSLVECTRDGEKVIMEDEVIERLKCALRVYGYRGIWRQLDDYLIEFSF